MWPSRRECEADCPLTNQSQAELPLLINVILITYKKARPLPHLRPSIVHKSIGLFELVFAKEGSITGINERVCCEVTFGREHGENFGVS